MKTIMLAMMLGLMAVSAAAQSVQTDYDRGFRFSELKTFSFADQQRAIR